MGELLLDGDRPTTAPTIAEYLRARAGEDPLRRAVARAVIAIAEAAGPVAFRLAQGELPGDPAHIVGTNTGGDQQKALDVAAHEHFLRALRAAGVQAVASEEAEEVALGAPDGLVSVAMDPIDGSSSIGIGALLGTLFAVLPAADGTEFYRQTGRSDAGRRLRVVRPLGRSRLHRRATAWPSPPSIRPIACSGSSVEKVTIPKRHFRDRVQRLGAPALAPRRAGLCRRLPGRARR